VHTRHCEALRVGTLFQQALNLAGWNAPLDRIAVDYGRVARPQWLRNAVFGLILGGAVHFLNIDFEAIGLEVFDPLGAASATADFLDGDLWARRRESHGHQQSGRTEESPRYFHIASMELYPRMRVCERRHVQNESTVTQRRFAENA
jgi:hypothetical protein